MSEMRQFRSRLNTLPIDMKVEIGEVVYQKGMRATSRRDKVVEVLTKYNIPFQNIGTGTNRHIIKYDGYVIKIALDREGVADNKQEWVMSEALKPHVADAFEISKGGHLLVASYAPAFTSLNEMMFHRTTITTILAEWSTRYLIGDVGMVSTNYANWGVNNQGKPVCIDYAYIFPASMNLFKCTCGNRSLNMINNYSQYKCPVCQKVYEDRDLRYKISQEDRLAMFENVEGIQMFQDVETHPVEDRYIVPSNNPDLPDVYETTFNAYMHMKRMGVRPKWD